MSSFGLLYWRAEECLVWKNVFVVEFGFYLHCNKVSSSAVWWHVEFVFLRPFFKMWNIKLHDKQIELNNDSAQHRTKNICLSRKKKKIKAWLWRWYGLFIRMSSLHSCTSWVKLCMITKILASGHMCWYLKRSFASYYYYEYWNSLEW